MTLCGHLGKTHFVSGPGRVPLGDNLVSYFWVGLRDDQTSLAVKVQK